MGKSRWIQLVLGALGLLLLLWMAQKIGLAALKQSLEDFGPARALFLILLYSLAQFCFCAAWYVLLNRWKDLGFWRTFAAYAAGDALNMTVPSANLAGEPVKVMLVKDKIPVEAAISSVTIYKLGDFISLTLFLLFGWLLHFLFFTVPTAWNIGAAFVAGGMAAASVLLYFLQIRGLYLPLGQWLDKLGFDWASKKLTNAYHIDKGIREFLLANKGRFCLSVFFNFLAWFGGVLEIFLFMKMAGLEASLAAALTIETFSLFINNVTFFVPARIGVGEGGRVLLFSALGYTSAAGLSYGILRRIRELSWVTAGLVILVLFKRNQSSSPNPASV